MGKRVFFALDIDDAMRRRIVAVSDPLVSLPGQVNWTRPENLHVTMNFIGDTPDERIAELCDLATEAVGRWGAGGDGLMFTVGPLVCFPPGRRTKMIWARLRQGADEVASLHAAMNQALADAGWPSESRAFKGHITVARIKAANLTGAVKQLPDDELGQVVARELTLYESTLTHSGPIYAPLARIPLVQET